MNAANVPSGASTTASRSYRYGGEADEELVHLDRQLRRGERGAVDLDPRGDLRGTGHGPDDVAVGDRRLRQARRSSDWKNCVSPESVGANPRPRDDVLLGPAVGGPDLERPAARRLRTAHRPRLASVPSRGSRSRSRRSSASSTSAATNQSSSAGRLSQPQPTVTAPSVQTRIRSAQSTSGSPRANHHARSPSVYETSGRRGDSHDRVIAACIARRSSIDANGCDVRAIGGGYPEPLVDFRACRSRMPSPSRPSPRTRSGPSWAIS